MPHLCRLTPRAQHREKFRTCAQTAFCERVRAHRTTPPPDRYVAAPLASDGAGALAATVQVQRDGYAIAPTPHSSSHSHNTRALFRFGACSEPKPHAPLLGAAFDVVGASTLRVRITDPSPNRFAGTLCNAQLHTRADVMLRRARTRRARAGGERGAQHERATQRGTSGRQQRLRIRRRHARRPCRGLFHFVF